MNTPTIDKHIPLPKPVGVGSPSKYPYRSMNVGDSFLYPKGVGIVAARSSANHAASRTNWKFSLRQTEQGIRCWRIA
jgi:hypothetical protein